MNMHPHRQAPWFSLAFAVFAIQAAALYFLFQPDAKAWFAEKNGPTNRG